MIDSRFPKVFFLSGTDTGVGKTIVSAIMALGLNAHYWKPIQSGCIPDENDRSAAAPDGETTDSGFMLKAGLDPSKILKERYLLSQPLSPHLAAELDGVSISLDHFKLPDTSAMKHLIIEGAGGLLVPINKQAKIIDLIKLFDFPVVLVARSKLGTINHTLLSLEALRSRDIKVAGVVINGEKNPENKKAIEEFGAVNILGEVPLLADFSRDSLLKCFKDNFLAQEFAASSI